MPFTVVEDRAQRIWEPNKRQADFVSLPDQVFEALFGGAAGGGKTDVLVLLPILKGWIHKSWFKGIIFRRSYKQLEESIIPRTREYYVHVGGKYNESKHVWTFPSGAKIFLSYLESYADALTHDTSEYNYIGWEELTHFEWQEYSFLTFSRVRGEIKCVRAATNPGNIGHVWVRDRFVSPDPAGYVLIKDKKSGELRAFIPSRVQDNAYLAKTDPTYVNRLQMLPEAERKAKLDGDWYSYAGQVFGEFRESHIDGEPENAIHVIEPFPIPSYWHKFAAIDWGRTAYTWIGWAAISPDRRVYIYREYHERDKYISEWATTFANLSLGDNLLEVAIDPSAQQKRGDPKTILMQFQEHSGYTPKLADNDRVSGKMLFHEYLRWTELPKREKETGEFSQETYDKILKHSGLFQAEQYKNFFEIDVTYPVPKLQIFNTCTALIKAIPLAKYNTLKGNPEDVAEWDPTELSPGDDPYDGGRYLLKLVDKWLKDPTLLKTHEQRVDLDRAVKKLSVTGDMNEFYRRMEILESKQKKTWTTVPRYRGRTFTDRNGRTRYMH